MRVIRMPRAALLASLVAIAGCHPPAAVTRRPDTAGLARTMPRLLQVSGIPGVSVAIVEDGRVSWARAFGTVNDSAGTPLDTATVFEAASLSKPVFAYLVLRLADRGEFDLDRPLFQMLEYPRLAADERYKRITARIVLSHGTGLPNWGGEKLTLRFEPGTDYGYSGEGFVYLQKVLEHTTGHSLDELARREVFEPLGMTRSSYVWQERFAGDVAYAKDWLWNVAPLNRYQEANAAASLVTTATDYAQFVATVLTRRGLSKEMWEQYLAPVRETGPGISIGLGVRVEGGPDDRIFYHSGNNGRRFTSYMTGDVAKRTGLVFFTSASNGTSLVAAIAPHVFGGERPPRNWSDFDRYDDPRLVALRSVQRAAVDGGADSARARLRAIGESAATRPTFDATLELGAFFAGRGLAPLAIDILRSAVAEAPESASAYLALGRAQEAAGDLRSAMESYRRAKALDADTTDALRHLEWTQERLRARAHPVVVPGRTIERYAGRYHERTITLRNGRLHYSGGPHPESSLTPLTENLFEVDADPATRIRFVRGGTGASVGVVALYSDGTFDEWPRSR